MCGIFGVIADCVDPSGVADATRKLEHRGPDDMGIYISPSRQVAFGHCRLSILDLSELGHQPMSNEDGNIWITYNGEIYNFKALRRDLEQSGHAFRSESDTEVIIHAYEEWGMQCLGRLRGMFAFALWDERKKSLFLARDRLGIKPVYYYWDGRQFLFGSELKSVETYPRLDLRIDATALYDFLTYRYIPTPKTPYLKVRKLPAAHYLVVHDGMVTIEQYWDVDFARIEITSEKEALQRLTSCLEDAIRLHLISDVPVGVLLSGGMDSSCVVAFASRCCEKSLNTFSIGFDQDGFSETGYARIVAERFRTRHVDKLVTAKGGRELFVNLLRIYDEPFADSSAIPTYEVCKLAAREHKVVLTGDGGDEVFAGYTWYSIFQWYDLFSVFPKRLTASLVRCLHFFPWELRGTDILGTFGEDCFEFYARLLGGFGSDERRRMLQSDWLAALKVPGDYDDYWYFRQFWRRDMDSTTRLQYLDLKTYLPDDILTKLDRASMAVSLEARPPLLDHKLVECVASIMPAIRNKHGMRKYLLKEALAQILPEEILKRAKKGFSPPLKSWLEEWSNVGRSRMEKTLEGTAKANALRPSKKYLLAILSGWLGEKGLIQNDQCGKTHLSDNRIPW